MADEHTWAVIEPKSTVENSLFDMSSIENVENSFEGGNKQLFLAFRVFKGFWKILDILDTLTI